MRNSQLQKGRFEADRQYCVECAKYYESDAALNTHTKSKVHKRRLKELREGAYTVEESERAAGLGTDNTQRGFEDVIRRFGDASVAQSSQQAQMQAEPGKMPQNNVVHHAPA